MLFNKRITNKSIVFLSLLTFLASIVVVGCQSAAPATEMEHEADHEHDAEPREESVERIPNDGAVIHIVSPADGDSFKTGDDIVVEVEVENFDLSAEANHWHLYVDGSVMSMIAGGPTKSVIHGLEPGEHTLEVYLGLTTHEELEDGYSVMITVTE